MAKLQRFVQRMLAVASPTRHLSFRPFPPSIANHNGRFLTILSANLWHDWPQHREMVRRLELVAQLIESEQVDIALLQEVARLPDLRADEWLAARLGMAYVYSRANGHETAVGFEEGLAIYSRYPLANPCLKQLGPLTNPFTRRLALGAKVNTPFGKLAAFSVHLSLRPRKNAVQVAQLQEWVTAVAGPHAALIGGDFNAHESTAQISQIQQTWLDTFRHLHPQADGTTHELRWPWGQTMRRRRLDYLFLYPGKRPWQVLEARHLDAPGGPHSDHRAVLVRLRHA